MTKHFSISALLVFASDGYLYLQQMGGEAAGITTFGVGTSPSDFVPLYTGLPNNPSPTGLVLVGFFSAGTTINFGMFTTLRRPGSLYPSQRSQGTHSGDGVQDLDARIVVAVERRHCGRTPSRDRVCRVGKPYPEVG